MSFAEIIGYLTIGPLKLLFEFVFSIAYLISHNAVISIFLLSLVVNVLVLPLYKRADSINEEENRIQKALEKGVKHIRKTFKGDERMMMLQTYYRQNNYNPIYVVRSSFSLLLQIPFFIAAYSFLSNLVMIQGTSFGPIADLGAEDRLISIGGFAVNVLPILMTLINIVSGAVFSKGKPVKTKIQLYITAVVFLVLLYKSPSGLVIYWTLNNVFSLAKNIVQKIVEKKRGSYSKKDCEDSSKPDKKNTLLFLGTGLFMSILVGGYVPSNVIQSSVAEFTNPYLMENPICYLLPSFLYSIGFFVIWAFVFYALSGKKIKQYFLTFFIALGIAFAVDYMFFGAKNNTLNPALQYFVFKQYSVFIIIINALIIAAVFILTPLLFKKARAVFSVAIPVMIIAIFAMTFINISKITKEYRGLYYIQDDLSDGANIKLSKEGKNVVVIMLDRAMGSQAPYIFDEIPELKDEYDGFTLYRNTVSFGCGTNIGAPAIYGGYEYDPESMNKRNKELLKDKHNEALKVMPVLFNNEGYNVTVCDPPYAGYQWFPDLSIYNDYPDINSFNMQYKYNPDNENNAEYTRELRFRNFFCYSLMSCSPIFTRGFLYNKGFYHKEVAFYENGTLSTLQVMEDKNHAHGLKSEFMDWYYALEELPNITEASNENNGSFVMLFNGLPHEPMMLQKPDYSVNMIVDNTDYDNETYTIDGLNMRMDTAAQVSHYQSNVLALKEVAKWLDMLKKEGIYDNTRIIIVSDHGADLGQFDLVNEKGQDYAFFLPLLMIKDFDEKGFNISYEPMTNADVVSNAVKGVIANPVNPFTGNVLDGHESKEEHKLLYSLIHDIGANGDYQFLPGDWYTVNGDVYDINNWKYLGNW